MVGVDPSPTMIRAARDADPDGAYHLAAAEALPLEDASVDLVIAFMSLHDIDDLSAAVVECTRVLRPEGRFCVAIVHPINSAGAFESEAADSPFIVQGSYLEERAYDTTVERNGLQMTFHSRHRSIETYSRTFESAGLVIELMREPPARTNERVVDRWARLPLFLHFRLRRAER
jgi:ubiquinone/menaquinone biosynthesis C-methylase UbiE